MKTLDELDLSAEQKTRLQQAIDEMSLDPDMGLIPKPEPTTMTPVNLREAMYFFGHTQIFRPPRDEHPTVDDL